MFKALKDSKIIAISEQKYVIVEIEEETKEIPLSPEAHFPYLVFDEVVKDDEHTVENYVQCDGEFVLTTTEKAIELKKEQVRQVRSEYFETYVDWYQSKPLYWEELSETEKKYRGEYRIYLKDCTKKSEWWKTDPLGYEEWLVIYHPVTEEESGN